MAELFLLTKSELIFSPCLNVDTYRQNHSQLSALC